MKQNETQIQHQFNKTNKTINLTLSNKRNVINSKKKKNSKQTMSAHNKFTDIEKKSNNAENVEMFFTTTEYVFVNGNNTVTKLFRTFKMADTKFRKKN